MINCDHQKDHGIPKDPICGHPSVLDAQACIELWTCYSVRRMGACPKGEKITVNERNGAWSFDQEDGADDLS